MRRRRIPKLAPDEALFAVAKKQRVPFEFVLAEIDDLGPSTKPMFGCLAVYVEDKIVFILRDRPSAPSDNGVWIATTSEHHESLRAELPSMRSIGVLGVGTTGWQNLPADAPDFEDSVLHACALVRRRDARIGKIPAQRKARAAAGRKKKATTKSVSQAKRAQSGRTRPAKRKPRSGPRS